MAKIRYKLTGLFVLLVVIAMSIVTYLVMWRVQVEVEREEISKMQYQAKYLVAGLQRDLDQVKNTAQTSESSLYSIWPKEGLNAQNIDAFKKDLANNFLQIGKITKPLSMWLAIDPKFLPGNHIVSFFKKDGVYQREKEYNIYDLDLSDPSMTWWTDAVKYGEVWTDPYYWANWNMELISYSKAIYIDSVFIGCLGSDFDFSLKRKEWSDIKINKTGYISLVNKDFKFILHPDFSQKYAAEVIPEEIHSLIDKSMKDSQDGYVKYNLEGEEKVLVYDKLSNGWGVIVIVPLKEINAPVYRLIHTILVIAISVILFSVIVAALFSRSITRPIYSLVSLFNKAADGVLTVRSSVKSNDEIKVLGNRFNRFMAEMQCMVGRLKDQEKKLIRERNRAEESDKLKTAFLNNLSHEIRTPLNAIAGYSELLVESELSEEEKKAYLKVVQDNNDKLIHFIDDIITLSKLEQGQVTCYPIETTIFNLFKKIKNDVAHIYPKGKHGVRLDFQFPEIEKDTCIKIDYTLLFKALQALLDNAFKYTEKGFVVLGAYIHQNTWGFYVEDTGVGIPTDYQKKVFNKFYKYKQSKKVLYDGVGMGLPITFDLLKLLKGEIKLESEVGKGSRFTVEFVL